MLFLYGAASLPATADRYTFNAGAVDATRRGPLTGSSPNSPDQPARQEIRRRFDRLTALRDLTIA
jgi:hypothetical protein